MAAFLLAVAVLALAGASGRVADTLVFHAIIPLGFEQLQLQPARTPFLLMATAESPHFEGLRRVPTGKRDALVDAAGLPVRHYPSLIGFRVTATTRSIGALSFDKPHELEVRTDPNHLLTGLTFKLKVFHGLDFREYEPSTVRNLGVPHDVPYDERIYAVSFELKDVPSDDRLVLEVYGDGQRLGRFHLELL